MITAAEGLLVVTGATGLLGGYLQSELARNGWNAVGLASRVPDHSRIPIQPADLGSEVELVSACRSLRPTHIIHAGAMSSVAECASDPDRAFQVNVQGTRVLVSLAEELHARLLFISTDLVFDGVRGNYRETDAPAPLSVYGRGKEEGESSVLSIAHSAVIRLSLLFGRSISGRPSFFDRQVRALFERELITLFHDEWRTPLHLRVAAPHYPNGPEVAIRRNSSYWRAGTIDPGGNGLSPCEISPNSQPMHCQLQ
jgi:dTDP-4-dehydrorhamnose reductase